MKRRKIWDSTHIFLVGLQSVGPERTGEISATNLYSEGTRTTLMVKPARKVRDGPFNWKIDTNVSLADLGATLFDLIGMSRPSASQTAFPIFSLKSALVGPEPDWPSHRMILLETGWPQWRHRGGIRAAVRKGSNFFLFDEEPLLFDTLTDIGELNPQRVGFFLGGPRAEIATFSEKLRSIGFQPWKELESVAEERAVLAHELWGESWGEQTSFTEVQQRLIETAKKHPEDQVLQSWRAIWAIRNSDWSELKSAASVARQPLWSYIAARNLGEKVAIPANEPCLSFLTDMATLSKDCRVEGWQDFLTWANESLSESVRTKAGDNFFRTYFGSKLATRVAEHNQFVGMICDSSEKLDKPGIFDLLLALPELKRQRALVRARLGAELGRHQTYRD